MAINTGIDRALRYDNSVKGEYKWDVLTQKPFAEFKNEGDQAHENSWLGMLVKQRWDKTTVYYESLTGAQGKAKWGDGKVSVELKVNGTVAKWFENRIVYEVGQVTLRACAYERTAEIEDESRQQLRNAALETYRDAYCNEIEAGILIGRWQTVDEITKVIAALTSSGSAVAGWLVWNEKGWPQNVWKSLAATAAVLSIMHVALKVSDRVKDWSDTKGHFVRLRTELETLLYHMTVNRYFPVEELAKKFDALRTRYGEGLDRKKVDPLAYKAAAKALTRYNEVRARIPATPPPVV